MQDEHRARKRFGQNFLESTSVIDQIISVIRVKPNEHLVEIGPGKGALTLPIAKQLQEHNRLTLLELDRDLAAKLEQQFSNESQINLVQADALFFDFCKLADNKNTLRIFGNLPYNISTPLIFHLLKQNDLHQQKNHHQCLFSDMHFMLQKEVVDRICAAPGSKTYGRLSVMTQYYCHTEHLFDVPPSAFSPQPKVTSAIIRLMPHAEKALQAKNDGLLATVVKAAFAQRRKTIRNTLRELLDSQQIQQLGIDPTQRAENLSLQNFIALSNAVTQDENNDDE